jgi:hypothetical protein
MVVAPGWGPISLFHCSILCSPTFVVNFGCKKGEFHGISIP